MFSVRLGDAFGEDADVAHVSGHAVVERLRLDRIGQHIEQTQVVHERAEQSSVHELDVMRAVSCTLDHSQQPHLGGVHETRQSALRRVRRLATM